MPPDVSASTRHKLARTRRLARTVLAAGLSYAALAYAALPEFWTIRDRHGLAAFGTLVTATPQGIPGDPINVALVGSKVALISAFATAGWRAADALTWRTSLDIGESVVLDRPYADAPVSTLVFFGRAQDLAFEKPTGISADQRHHVRFWLADGDGVASLWLGAASFDRGVGFSHDTGQITHHIAPDIDAERQAVMEALGATGRMDLISTVEGAGATQTGRNGGGDPYVTDGQIAVGRLRAP